MAWQRGRLFLFLTWDVHLLLSLDTGEDPGSWAFKLELDYIISFPASPACRRQIVGLLVSITTQANS